MTRRLPPLAGAVAIATGLGLPMAPALGAELVTAADVERIAEIARDFGEARIETAPTGEPLILGTMEETGYAILFYGCVEGAECSDIQFVARWAAPYELDLEVINRWNAAARFATAWRDPDGDAVLEFAINLEGGVTAENLADSFDWWRLLIAGFVVEVLSD
ncbi:MAG: YbjN domain-containing protein [Alkalilacustris sp.]